MSLLKTLRIGFGRRKGIEWEGSLIIEMIAVMVGLTIAVLVYMALMSNAGSGTSCQNNQFMNYASSLVADVQGTEGICQ
mgnify:CR=1 FL=1